MDINGHWHVPLHPTTDRYITLDIVEDTICQLNHFSFWNSGKGRVLRKKKKIYIDTEKGFGGYFYDPKNENEIELADLQDGNIFNAFRCSKECCDPYQEMMGNLIVDIEMPQEVTHAPFVQLEKGNAAYLFFGRPDKEHNEAYGTDIHLCLNNQFTTVYTLPFYHDNNLERFEKEKFDYRIIADVATTMGQIEGAIRELKKIGVSEIFVATHFNAKEKVKEPFLFFNASLLEIEEENLKWGDYLNGTQ